MIVCRSEKPIDISIKEKISLFCHVDTKKVINIPDCPTIYHVPLVMKHQGMVDLLNEQLCLGMTAPKKFMKEWRILAEKAENLRKDVEIALVGKYTKLEDAYASVIKALNHAALTLNYKLRLTYIGGWFTLYIFSYLFRIICL